MPATAIEVLQEQLRQLNVEIAGLNARMESAENAWRQAGPADAMAGRMFEVVSASISAQLDKFLAARRDVQAQLAVASSPPGPLAEDKRKLDTIYEHTIAFSKQIPILFLAVKRQLKPPSDSQRSRGSNQAFRKKVVRYYVGDGALTSSTLPDMVLGQAIPAKFVVAAHLFEVRNQDMAKQLLGPDFDVNAPGNGLLWNSAFEEAFEAQQMCFSYRGDGAYTLHCADRTIWTSLLADHGQHRNDPEWRDLVGNTTYGQLHGRMVDFGSYRGGLPSKRALSLHARRTLDNCTGRYPDEFDAEGPVFDYMSEFDGKDALYRLFWEAATPALRSDADGTTTATTDEEEEEE